MNYSEQKNWKNIMSYLPQEYHLKDSFMPKEEHWEWNKNDVHLDTFRNPNAKAKVILFHGVGTNGRQMTTIIGAPLAKDGYEVIAVDMPLYGVTEIHQKKVVSYHDWVQLGSDLIDYELTKDNRPVFLYGLSAGGMETYHVACKNKKVKGIIGMTFLDQNVQAVRNETTNNAFWAHMGTPLAGLSVKLGLGKFRMKSPVISFLLAEVGDAFPTLILLYELWNIQDTNHVIYCKVKTFHHAVRSQTVHHQVKPAPLLCNQIGFHLSAPFAFQL